MWVGGGAWVVGCVVTFGVCTGKHDCVWGDKGLGVGFIGGGGRGPAAGGGTDLGTEVCRGGPVVGVVQDQGVWGGMQAVNKARCVGE